MFSSQSRIVLVASSLFAPALAQVTQRVSVATSGAQSDGPSLAASISADGRCVAFRSEASNLVSGDTNGVADIFVRDRLTGVIERVSVATGGTQGNSTSDGVSISADGRCVAFRSFASNLVAGDTNLTGDIFVRDRLTGTTERVSVSSSGAQGFGDCQRPAISGDGRFVAFHSWVSNFVPGDTNGADDVFVHDRQTGTTERVSVDSNGVQGNGYSQLPSISGDGRFVAFRSFATNLVPGDTNSVSDIFVHDRRTGSTERVSVATGGAEANDASEYPSISDDGRFVAFSSPATNLVPGDTNGVEDIFVHDRLTGTTERVSVATSGAEGNSDSSPLVYGDDTRTLSGDGRFVAFQSAATNLVQGDTNGWPDVFVRDRQNGTTERISVGPGGAQGNNGSGYLSISADGRWVEFYSRDSNLVPGDTNGVDDIFVADRVGGPDFTSLCDPGVTGVLACPCSNPPSGPARGCDNSAATGGASLAAAGGTYLSSDSLVFTTSGENPTALSIVTQWTGSNASGAIFGMGVRCTSGTFKRLYTKPASSGSITAPNFGGGDPPVSVRSAAQGDTILSGQSRWYFVYYRDPNVLGGCPANRTFNATQTGRVTWSP